MEKSFVRQTRSKTKAAKQSNLFGEEHLSTYEHDLDNPTMQNCIWSNAEDASVGTIFRARGWMDTNTVHSKEFCCAECSSKRVPERSARSGSGRSSATSGRRSHIDREIQRLEDERRAEEQVEQERIQQEKLLIEKAAKEKLEREKQFIARKHELLRQQDDDIESFVSRRSSSSSILKVEKWVEQHISRTGAVGGSEKENIPESVEPQESIPVGSSTPLGGSAITAGNQQPAADEQRASVPRTIESITIGDSPEEDFPKLHLRGKAELQQAYDEKKELENRLHEIESNLKRQRHMELEHQQENELRRRREIELVNRLNRLEEQRAGERQQLQEVENALKRQLEDSQQRYQALETKRRQEHAAREEELRRLKEREQQLAQQLESVLLREKIGHPSHAALPESTGSGTSLASMTLYGRPEQIVHHMVTKVRATPAPRADKLETLIQFGLVVQNLCGHLQAIGMENHLSNPILLQELVDKLPANIKFSWALYQEQQPIVNLRTFGEYMGRVTTATSGITNVCPISKHQKDEKPKAKEKAYVNTHTTYEKKKQGSSASLPKGDQRVETSNIKRNESDTKKECPLCKSHDHIAEKCVEFKKLSVNERWKVVKEKKLCRRCLIAHTRWPCEGEVCGVNECQKRHHRLLHYDPKPEQPLTTTNATVTVHRQPVTSTLFKILPVTLYGKTGIDTYAFLDDGSSTTLLEQSIADELGVDGKVQSLCMQWTSGINKKVATTQIVKLGISEPGSRKVYQLSEVYTVENLGLPEQSIDVDELAKQYKHLQRLPVKSFQRATPGLLIGVNNIHLLNTAKIREGKEQEPIAAKTRIGWVVCGCLRGEENQFLHRQMHICAELTELDLHNYVREFFSVESIGVAVAPNLEGKDDQRARLILEGTTIRKTDGKFETGLLWKQDDFEFPDSRPMAERRLKCLERRLERDPKLYDSVRQQIADYEFKGYIHVVTDEERAKFDPRRTWYLPLGVVLNPNKPGKVRVIWDAAAKVNGVSLNTMLLKGPDR
ncbi:uncharacterized protein LOC135709839 [Ochlerotatus camptorhynchus]|uniref:uncharacterized protein LOC135709839 n=1 Tax=Ochlerotatus camptorhynchus TaxID=644619 RepID=UPI0031CE2295